MQDLAPIAELAEIRWAALPLSCVIPSTDIGSAAPVVLTYIVSARLPVFVLSVALTATALCPSLVDVFPLVSVPRQLDELTGGGLDRQGTGKTGEARVRGRDRDPLPGDGVRDLGARFR